MAYYEKLLDKKYFECHHFFTQVVPGYSKCEKCGTELAEWPLLVEIDRLVKQRDDLQKKVAVLLAACEEVVAYSKRVYMVGSQFSLVLDIVEEAIRSAKDTTTKGED